MSEALYIRPIIETNDFLYIFLSASFILLFGAVYASVITLVKMKKVKKIYSFLAYGSWLLQVYYTYYLTKAIHSQPFTVKAMIIAMIAYLIVPHIYFYLIEKTEERYKN